MAEFPALPLWTDAYLSDTRHLSCEQHGAYLLLLMEAWRRPTCSLPNDDEVLARLACLSVDRWMAIRDVVMAFWKYDGRRKDWHQLRLDDERAYVAQKRSSQRDKAAKRWSKTRNTDAAAMPEGMPDECPDDAPTPTPTSKGSEDKSSEHMPAKAGAAGTKSKRQNYPAPFDELWKAYPTTRNMSKSDGFKVWSRLSAEDKALAAKSIPNFVAYCKTNPTYPVIYLERYLSKRRFEGHAEDGGAAVTEVDWQKRLEHARKKGWWGVSDWGPFPGQLGCLVPSELLQPGDGVGWVEWKPRQAQEPAK